jgi:hypothetical protein
MSAHTRSIARNHWLTLIASLALCASASPALAQGRGHGGSKGLPPGQAKKMVTPAQAVELDFPASERVPG